MSTKCAEQHTIILKYSLSLTIYVLAPVKWCNICMYVEKSKSAPNAVWAVDTNQPANNKKTVISLIPCRQIVCFPLRMWFRWVCSHFQLNVVKSWNLLLLLRILPSSFCGEKTVLVFLFVFFRLQITFRAFRIDFSAKDMCACGRYGWACVDVRIIVCVYAGAVLLTHTPYQSFDVIQLIYYSSYTHTFSGVILCKRFG